MLLNLSSSLLHGIYLCQEFNTKHLAIVSGLKIIIFVGGQSLHHKFNISQLNNGNHEKIVCFTH